MTEYSAVVKSCNNISKPKENKLIKSYKQLVKNVKYYYLKKDVQQKHLLFIWLNSIQLQMACDYNNYLPKQLLTIAARSRNW